MKFLTLSLVVFFAGTSFSQANYEIVKDENTR